MTPTETNRRDAIRAVTDLAHQSRAQETAVEKMEAALRVRDGQIDSLIARATAASSDCIVLRDRVSGLVDLVRRLQREMCEQARSEFGRTPDYIVQQYHTVVKLEALYMAKRDPVRIEEGAYLLEHMVVTRPERARIIECATRGPLSDRAIDAFAAEVAEKMAEKIAADVTEQLQAQKRGEPSRW